MTRRKLSRVARKILAPLRDATEPVPLAYAKFDRGIVLDAIREAGDLIRVCDDPDPVTARYVLTAEGHAALMTGWDRFKAYLSLIWR